jgi:hypothetical protein
MEPQGSLVLRAASVGLALGMLFALGVVIGSRSPDAVEHYNLGSAAIVLLKLGAAVGVLAGCVGAVMSTMRAAIRHRRAAAAPASS